MPGTTIPTDIMKPAKIKYKGLFAKTFTVVPKLKYFSNIIRIIPIRKERISGIILFILKTKKFKFVFSACLNNEGIVPSIKPIKAKEDIIL